MSFKFLEFFCYFTSVAVVVVLYIFHSCECHISNIKTIKFIWCIIRLCKFGLFVYADCPFTYVSTQRKYRRVNSIDSIYQFQINRIGSLHGVAPITEELDRTTLAFRSRMKRQAGTIRISAKKLLVKLFIHT